MNDNSPFQKPLEIASLLADFDRPWYMAGGWAIDLFLGEERRPHKDIDIAIFRQDQTAIGEYLMARGFPDLKRVVGEGELMPWQPEEWLELPAFQVFVQVGDEGFPELEILFNEVEDGEWWYRRNREVKRPVEDVGMRSEVASRSSARRSC